jgi:hypothetical protein
VQQRIRQRRKRYAAGRRRHIVNDHDDLVLVEVSLWFATVCVVHEVERIYIVVCCERERERERERTREREGERERERERRKIVVREEKERQISVEMREICQVQMEMGLMGENARVSARVVR